MATVYEGHESDDSEIQTVDTNISLSKDIIKFKLWPKYVYTSLLNL